METIAAIFAIIGGIIGWFITYLKFKLERKDKFRIAAIEKRLEAHQKAYSQCMKFFDILDSHDENEVKHAFKDGQTFMANYSLYLEKGTRKKFIEVLGFLNAYCPREKYLKLLGPNERMSGTKKYIEEEEKVFELANLIQTEVALEPIALINPNQKVKRN